MRKTQMYRGLPDPPRCRHTWETLWQRLGPAQANGAHPILEDDRRCTKCGVIRKERLPVQPSI